MEAGKSVEFELIDMTRVGQVKLYGYCGFPLVNELRNHLFFCNTLSLIHFIQIFVYFLFFITDKSIIGNTFDIVLMIFLELYKSKPSKLS